MHKNFKKGKFKSILVTLFLAWFRIKIPSELGILIFPNGLSPQKSNQLVGVALGVEM